MARGERGVSGARSIPRVSLFPPPRAPKSLEKLEREWEDSKEKEVPWEWELLQKVTPNPENSPQPGQPWEKGQTL